jgi:putative transposase
VIIYTWIKEHRKEFPVAVMCDVMEVARAVFYDWMKNPERVRDTYRRSLIEQIEQIHQEPHMNTYGSPRITKELNARGVEVCEKTVAKVMKEADIHAKHAKRFVPTTTDSKHEFPVPANTLNRDFTATAPNQKWLCEITYIPTDEGWMYLAGVLDCYSRKIVGWSMDDRMPAELVSDAFTMAIDRRKPAKGLLHHSDRGVQYACGKYQSLLGAYGIACSMSRKGNCWDNAMKESFWSTLKREAINGRRFKTIEAARAAVFEYIEVIYNRVRRHRSLGDVSPECFEASRN